MVENIAVLGSGIGLGFYLPGMVTKHQLETIGYKVDSFVFEDILKEEKKTLIPEIKKIFQKNFRIALISQKIINDVTQSIDDNKKNEIINTLKNNNVTKIICFSGFWIPIINEYIQLNKVEISVDFCHVDSIMSVSWKMYDCEIKGSKHIFFNSWEHKDVLFRLDISNENPLKYEERNNSLSVHGGGWGIGDFLKKAKILNDNNFDLDITVNNIQDMNSLGDNNRFFMMKNEWNAWEKDINGKFSFPPFAEILTNNEIVYKDNGKYPLVYDLIKQNKAIISKPGGGTLLDSYSAATPLIYLKPYGEYEEKNGKLWEELGFGTTFEKWEKSNFSYEMLKEFHENIMEKRNKTPNYIEECVKCNQ